MSTQNHAYDSVSDEYSTQQPQTDTNNQSLSSEVQKNDSLTTVFAIANSMIGSVVLVLPPEIYQGGLLLSIVLMTLLGFVSFQTATYIVKYQTDSDKDLSDIIMRVLGKVWTDIFLVTSFLLLFIAGMIYYILMNSVLYPILTFIIVKSGADEPPPADTINFSNFSIQYQCIILMIPCFYMFTLRDISFILRLAQIGILAVAVYGIFILYLVVAGLVEGRIQRNWSDLKMWTPNVAGVGGSFALAFFVHNIITPIIAKNQNKSKNVRDLGFGYLLVYVIYGFIGCLGAIGVIGLNESNVANKHTIMDYFQVTDARPVLVEFMFLIQLGTALPYLNFISRSQFFNLLKMTPERSEKYFMLYNIIFALGCIILQILVVSPSVVIGIDGAICAFYIVYIIPFFLRKRMLENGIEGDQLSMVEAAIEEERMKTYKKENVSASLVSDSSIISGNYVSKNKREIEMSSFQLAMWLLAITIGVLIGVSQLLMIFGVDLNFQF